MYTVGMVEGAAHAGVEESVPAHERSVLGVRAGTIVLLSVIFVAALGVRLGWVAYTDTEIPPLSDPQYYHATAENLADGRGYTVAVDERGFVAGAAGEATAFWAPGYPFALAPLYAAFGPDERAAKVFNAIVGALTVVPVFLLGRRMGGRRGRRPFDREGAVREARARGRDGASDHRGIVAAALFAMCPALVFWTPALFSEPLFTFGVAWTLVVAMWAGVRQAWWMFFLAGVTLAATAMVRSQALVLIVPVLLLAEGGGRETDRVPAPGPDSDAVRGQRAERMLRFARHAGQGLALAVVWIVVGMAAFVVPWAVRNERAMGEPFLINDNLGYNLRLAHAPYSTGTSIAPRDLWDERPGITFRERELWWDEVGASRAWEYARTHPGREVELAQKRVGWLLRSDAAAAMRWSESLGRTPVGGPRDALVLVGDVYWYGLLALAGASLALVRRDRLWWAMWSALGAWVGLHIVFAGEPRYHVPMVPVLCVLAAAVAVRRRDAEGLREHD